MIQSEAQLEQQFLEKLQEMKYTYRSDIRDLDALENNFRQKFERLNFVSLSASQEVQRLLSRISVTLFFSSRSIVSVAGEHAIAFPFLTVHLMHSVISS